MHENVLALQIDPERMRKEDERRFWLDSGAALGGTVAGGAVGSLAVNPMLFKAERAAAREAMEEYDNFHRNKEILQTLDELHHGDRSWYELSPEADPVLREMYEEHNDLLRNPEEMKRLLAEKGPDLPHMPKFQLKRLLPNAEMLRNLGAVIQHPAVGIGAALGAGYAGMTMENHHRQRFYDMLQKERDEANLGGVILNGEG